LISGATSVFAITSDGERYRATIVGMTAWADIALLRIDAGRKPLPVVHFGDSDKVRVGDRVIAIGSPFGFDNTVTAGIVSGINRNVMESPFDAYLQTDAAINHGNSGGPLLNEAGEVVGMTSVIFSPDRGSSGLGFAVPSNGLQFAFERLMKTGKVEAGMLPVHTQPVGWGLKQAFHMPDLHGALVTSIDDSAVKRLREIQVGDVITSFNGQPVLDPRDLARKAARSQIGSVAELVLRRGDQTEAVHLTIEAMPESKPIPPTGKPRTLGLTLVGEKRSNGDHIVKVASIAPNGTAAESGLRRGDILVEIQHTPVTQPEQVLQVLRDASSTNQHFAAVLVRRDRTLSWIALEAPD
jgi:serine protease Do